MERRVLIAIFLVVPGAVRVPGALRRRRRRNRRAEDAGRRRQPPPRAHDGGFAADAPPSRPRRRLPTPASTRARRRDRPSATSASKPTHVIAVVHQPRRAAEELAAEALPRRSRASRSSSSPTRLPATQPLPFSLPRRRCGRHAHAERRALRRARVRRRRRRRVDAPTQLAFEYRDSSRPARREGVSARAGVLRAQRSAPTVHQRRSSRCRRRSSGAPASATEPSATGRYARAAARAVVDCRRRRAARRRAPSPNSRPYEGDFQFAGIDDHYFMTRWRSARARRRSRSSRVTVPPLAGERARRRAADGVHASSLASRASR